MLSALLLLVSELPDSHSTATINPVGAICLIRRKTPAFQASKTATCLCLMVEHPPEVRAEKTPRGHIT